jgi:hypothetical protein
MVPEIATLTKGFTTCLVFAFLVMGCQPGVVKKPDAARDHGTTKENAISIAKADAVAKYGPLEPYPVLAVDELQWWHVIFEEDEGETVTLEYFVDRESGRILETTHRRYVYSHQPPREKRIATVEMAIAVTRQDALKNHKLLDRYEILAYEEGKRWHVVLELKDETITGGGTDYIIEKATGNILDKKHSQ